MARKARVLVWLVFSRGLIRLRFWSLVSWRPLGFGESLFLLFVNLIVSCDLRQLEAAAGSLLLFDVVYAVFLSGCFVC
jgi:hypothetical protein